MRFDEKISVRVPSTVALILKITNKSLSETVRAILFKQALEIAKDPTTLKTLKLEIEQEIEEINTTISKLRSKLKELEKRKAQLELILKQAEEIVQNVQSLQDEIVECVKRDFKKLHENRKLFTPEELKDFIQTRIKVVSERFACPESFVAEILKSVYPDLADYVD